MPDYLTPEERTAIESYDGEVEICPPRTFSEEQGAVSWRASMGLLFNKGRKREAARRSKERREQYVRFIAQGKINAEIAEELVMTEHSVRKALRRYRLNSSRRVSPKSRDGDIKRLALQGMACKAIARETKASDDTVRNAMRRLGIYDEWKALRGKVNG